MKKLQWMFLIKDNDLVLIETGPSIYYDSIKNSLNKINIDINRIKNVLVTHIHLDHSEELEICKKWG